MEKITQDLNAVPDTDPRTWRHHAHPQSQEPHPESGKYFNFNDSHEPWEFPLISHLGLTQRVQYWALDEDSDSVLWGYCQKWLKDVHSREEELSIQGEAATNLLSAAKALQEAMDEVDAREQAYTDHIKAKVDARIAASGLTEEEYEARSEQLRQENPSEWLNSSVINEGWETTSALIKAKDKAASHMQGEPMANFLLALVEAEYEVSEEGIREHCAQLFAGKKYIDSLGLDYYMEHDLARPSNAYRHHVFAYPGYNLPSYFYDEMVFMNYVQATVGHDYGEGEIALVEKAIQDGITKEWFREVISTGEAYWRGWWT